MRELLKWAVTLIVAIPLWSLATLAPIFWFVSIVQRASEPSGIDPKDFFLFATAVAIFGLFLSNKHIGPECLRPQLSKAAVLYILSALSWVLLGTLFALDPDSIIYEHWLIQVLAVACFGIGHAGFVWGSFIWLFHLDEQFFGARSVVTRPRQKPSADKSHCGVPERRRPASLAFCVVAVLVAWSSGRGTASPGAGRRNGVVVSGTQRARLPAQRETPLVLHVR